MRKNKGFTLIELMIVVAIVGVISSIAYPSYNSYVNKSRRTDAKVALLRMADFQERFYLQNNTYTTNTANVGGTTTPEDYYTLSIGSANVNQFTITATAKGAQLGDKDCQSFTVNSIGQRSAIAGSGGDATRCW